MKSKDKVLEKPDKPSPMDVGVSRNVGNMSEVKLVTQGAEGRVYTSKWLGKDVIVKHRFKKSYRHPDLDSQITKERMKAEARILLRCRMAGINVPTLYDVNLTSNELIMENLPQAIQVRKYIYDNTNSSLQPLAEKIGQMLGKLQMNNIIHGDLTTSNMLVKQCKNILTVYLIDFGLSYISEQVEDKAVDLYVLERSILSTHPNCDEFMKTILNTYVEEGGNKTKNVITKLDHVRLRGRKKLCFG